MIAYVETIRTSIDMQGKRRKVLEDKCALYDRFDDAAHDGNLITVLEMLSSGSVHVDGCGTRHWGRMSALRTASRAGRMNIVQALIRAGADVNFPSFSDGTTPLHSACRNGRSAGAVKVLLDAGADVNARNKDGATALFLVLNSEDTSEEKKLDLVRLLLTAKCDVNVEFRGVSTLFSAFKEFASYEIRRLLIAAGADLTKRDSEGMTALHLSVMDRSPVELIQMSLENGVDVNAKRGHDGKMALHMAAGLGHLEVARLLIKNNADVLMQDNHKRTVLMDAVNKLDGSRQEKLLSVQFILSEVSKMNTTDHLNLQDADGWTALHYATVWGSRSSIHELLCLKPDLTCKTVDEGYTALHNLFSHQLDFLRLDILRCFVEHENGYRSNEANIQDLCGRTVLHLALEQREGDDVAIFECLSSLVDVSIANVKGETALHTALYCGASQAVISALLGSTQSAVAANLQNGAGKTALHDAMVLQNMDAALAIARIANVNVPDSEGKTALHHAILLDEPLFLEFLLHERNGDPLLRDHQGHTPLALACMMDTCDNDVQLSMIYALLQHGVAYGKLQNML